MNIINAGIDKFYSDNHVKNRMPHLAVDNIIANADRSTSFPQLRRLKPQTLELWCHTLPTLHANMMMGPPLNATDAKPRIGWCRSTIFSTLPPRFWTPRPNSSSCMPLTASQCTTPGCHKMHVPVA